MAQNKGIKMMQKTIKWTKTIIVTISLIINIVIITRYIGSLSNGTSILYTRQHLALFTAYVIATIGAFTIFFLFCSFFHCLEYHYNYIIIIKFKC